MSKLNVKRFTYEFTRQADVTPYAAQDAVGLTSSGTILAPLLPVKMSDLPEQGLIVDASYQIKSIKVTKSANSTTNATFDLYLYSSGVIISAQDNQPFNLDYGNKHVRIGKAALTMATAGTTSTCAEAINVDSNLIFKAVGQYLYAQLVATGAYTPGVSEKFYIEVELLVISE